MKIVILSDDFPPKSFGGAGIVAFMQAKELAKRGHEVSVITTVQERGLEEKITHEGLVVFRLYTQYKNSLRSYISLYNPQIVSRVGNILHELQPDVVHAHNTHQFLSYHSLSIAKKYAKKVCLTLHDTMPVSLGKLYPKITLSASGEKVFDYKVSVCHQIRYFGFGWNPLRNTIIKFYIKKADTLLAVSSALKDALNQNGIDGIEVLHNGIDPESFKVNEGAVRAFQEKYNLLGKKVLFFSGRVSRAKGIDVCLKLIKELSKTIPEITLLIAGQDNAYVQEILSKEEFAGLQDKVIFTGWLSREDVMCAYHSSTLIPVLSLYVDPFPTTNLEAMLTKKPVLGTCFGGTPEIVKNKETGFIVDPYDFPEVFEKAKTLLEDSILREKFGIAGHERLMNKFQLNNQIILLEKIFNK